MSDCIDLHTHSTESDGTDSPTGVVEAAIDAGVTVLALTDHDTTTGWAEAERVVRSRPDAPTLVRGMEMSCTGRGEDGDPVTVHLLAYLFDADDRALEEERRRLRAERDTRLRSMIGKMAAAGYAVDADEILDEAGGSAGRPHLARALVDLGVVSTVGEAFEDLLKTGGRFYVEKADTPLDDAVAMIAAAGGVSVIAHARARRRGRLLHLDHILDLARGGLLGGLEVDHPDHDPADAELLRGIAREHGLIVTGSSDYHGTNKTTPIAARTTDPDQYAALVDRATGIDVVLPGSSR
ncbi:PHP domain-containing protein [Rhodococcoides corynebacterioides]|uniref:PHP domain-containing protein n=1 Tax=Rhodococcoides corynebacterioides TaxID=53972 RepID=UPI003F7FE534